MKQLRIITLTSLYVLFGTESIFTTAAAQVTPTVANLEAAMIALQEQSLLDQFNILAAAGITEITPAQIATIPTSLIPVITNDQIVQFLPAQIAAFTTGPTAANPAAANQIAAFLPGQIAAFTVPTATNTTIPNQIGAFTSGQIAAMLPAQVAALSTDQLNAVLSELSTPQVQALINTQVQALSTPALTAQLASLTKPQVQFLLQEQITGLDIAIAPQISNLSATQFGWLQEDQIQQMQNSDITAQLKNLSVTQMGYLLPAQIAGITTAQINNMTQDQLNALQAILQNSTIITTQNNPNLAAQINAIAKAPGKGMPTTQTQTPTPASSSHTKQTSLQTSKDVITNKTVAEKKSDKFFNTGK